MFCAESTKKKEKEIMKNGPCQRWKFYSNNTNKSQWIKIKVLPYDNMTYSSDTDINCPYFVNLYKK